MYWARTLWAGSFEMPQPCAAVGCALVDFGCRMGHPTVCHADSCKATGPYTSVHDQVSVGHKKLLNSTHSSTGNGTMVPLLIVATLEAGQCILGTKGAGCVGASLSRICVGLLKLVPTIWSRTDMLKRSLLLPLVGIGAHILSALRLPAAC
jgi:hypothetical protein